MTNLTRRNFAAGEEKHHSQNLAEEPARALVAAIGEEVGRRPVLLGATLYFSLLTLLTAQVANLEQLLAIRFIGGLGLGAIMPNAVALLGEYSPKKSRVMAMLIVSNGFTIGAAVAGFIATYLIPRFGWRSVFYFGGTVPLVIGRMVMQLSTGQTLTQRLQPTHSASITSK